MPDLVMHHFFGRTILSSLDKEIVQKVDNLPLYDFATAGPDPFFFVKFLNPKINKESHAFGNYMHVNKTRDFFVRLTNVAKTDTRMFNYLCGFIAHYALDVYCHPYIFYHTGVYKKNDKSTLEYRGLHTLLERAIDVYIINDHYYNYPYQFKIHKEILKLRNLDLSYKESFDEVYKIFDKNDGFDHVNSSIKYQRKFYKFIYDPHGIKQKLFTLLDNKKSDLDLKGLSYYKKGIKNDELDIFNKDRNEWSNPINETIVSNDSFFDLVIKAKDFAINIITNVYEYVFCDKEVKLESIFTNLSYLTGLNCEIKKEMYNFNNIFKKTLN